MTKRAVLFIPGVNAESQNAIFESLRIDSQRRGMRACDLGLWSTGKDLERLTIGQVVESIRNAVTILLDEGYDSVYAVGKSFGGAMLLMANDDRISKMVLWAAAVKINGSATADMQALFERPLSEVNLPIEMDPALFSRIKGIPLLIIHGENDEAVPIKDSEDICGEHFNCKLKMFPDLAHSPKDSEQIKKLVGDSLDFLD